jgi:hypothetical protein
MSCLVLLYVSKFVSSLQRILKHSDGRRIGYWRQAGEDSGRPDFWNQCVAASNVKLKVAKK